jgi:CRP-like cAMP-binding protein
MFFGTSDQFAQDMELMMQSARYFIFDCKRVTEFDATGVRTMEQVARLMVRRGKRAVLAHVDVQGPNGRFLADLGLGTAIPEDRWFADTDHALEFCENRLIQAAFPEDQTLREMPLGSMEIATGFSGEEIELLRAFLDRKVVKPGEYLFREGDEGDRMYVLAQGAISITLPRQGAMSGAKRLVTLTPGVMFGEMVLLESTRPRSADAVADDLSTVYALKRDVLDFIDEAHPALANKLMRNISRMLSERLRSTTDELRAAST